MSCDYTDAQINSWGADCDGPVSCVGSILSCDCNSGPACDAFTHTDTCVCGEDSPTYTPFSCEAISESDKMLWGAGCDGQVTCMAGDLYCDCTYGRNCKSYNNDPCVCPTSDGSIPELDNQESIFGLSCTKVKKNALAAFWTLVVIWIMCTIALSVSLAFTKPIQGLSLGIPVDPKAKKALKDLKIEPMDPNALKYLFIPLVLFIGVIVFVGLIAYDGEVASAVSNCN